MALTETFQTHNSWREEGRFDRAAPGRERRTNQWSDAAALGDEVEGFLSAVTRPAEIAVPTTSFLASADAQLPGTGKNNWREPLDETERNTSA